MNEYVVGLNVIIQWQRNMWRTEYGWTSNIGNNKGSKHNPVYDDWYFCYDPSYCIWCDHLP